MNKDKFIEIEGKIYKKDDIVQLSKAMYIDFKKYPAFKKVNPLLKEVKSENN